MILRSIDLRIGDTSYTITFRTEVFGRVKDIKVYSGPAGDYLQSIDPKVKIETQEISAVQALKETYVSKVKDSITSLTSFLLHKFRLWL